MAAISEILERSAAEIARDVNAGVISAVDVTEATLARVETAEPRVGAYLTVLHELARDQAAQVDARVRSGERPPLAGVPLAVKDNMCLTGTRTTAGSKILDGWVAPYTATAVARMLDAGCIPIGKANLDEFAMGSSCENSALGVTRNPYDLERVPGGSSGGSAAAVAAREAALGMGSDTGGSIREPGAFCNLIGFKPTYGRVSRYGLIAFASSLDQIGPLTRTVEDAALAYEAMSGKDPMDATSIDRAVEPAATNLREHLRGLRIGLVREFDTEKLGADVDVVYKRAYEELKQLGAQIVDVSLPTADYGLATYYLIAPAECSSNLSRFDGVRYGHRAAEYSDLLDMYCRTRAEGFGAEVKRRILVGTYVLSHGYYDAYYLQAQRVRRLIARDFARAFERCDVILGPTSPGTAFELGAKSDDPVQMYLNDIFTIPAPLAGLPGLSIPCGFDGKGLPVGLQLMGPHFSEARLLGVAHRYQQASDWHLRVPGGTPL